MSSQIALEQLEQQIAQLPVYEQLKLIARISEHLSIVLLDMIAAAKEEEPLPQQR